MATIGGDVEAHAGSAERHRLAVNKDGRIVRLELPFGHMDEGTVAKDRREVATPGTKRSEEAWVAQADVHRAESAGTQTFKGTIARTGQSWKVCVNPRHDILDDVALPDARPFALPAMHDWSRD